jgi:predicted nucleic acid-binding protein
MRALRKRVKPDTMSVREMTNKGRDFASSLYWRDFQFSKTASGCARASAMLCVWRDYSLSAYDAAYLELAIRHSVPLATLARDLRTAAKPAGIRIFP